MKRRNLARYCSLFALTLALLTCAAPVFASTAPTTGSHELLGGIIAVGIVTAGLSLKELREKFGNLCTKLDEFRAKNDDESREWTAEDQQGYDALGRDINTIERAIEMSETMERGRAPANDFEEPDQRFRGDGEEDLPQLNNRTATLAFAAWCRTANEIDPTSEELRAAKAMGMNLQRSKMDFRLLPPECYEEANERQMWVGKGGPVHRSRFRRAEERDLSFGTDSAGGYTVPTGFSNELERQLLAFGGPRRVCRIFRTESGNNIPWPTVNDTSNTGARLAENTTIGSSVDPTFGVKNLDAYKYSSKPILISEELLQDSAFNMPQLMAELLGERIGRIQATEFTTGDGSSKPNGIVTASGAGVTAAGTTAVTPDELLSLVHSVDPAYRDAPSVGWMFNDNTLLKIRQLKQDGKYLWAPGLTAGEPNRILDFPYTVNQAVASMAASAKAIVFGDMMKFVIRDAGTLRLYRLNERYRDLDQTGFVAFLRSDSECIQTAAIKHLVMAAS